MKVKFHLSPPVNDGMSLSLTDKSHKSDKFSTLNVFCQRVQKNMQQIRFLVLRTFLYTFPQVKACSVLLFFFLLSVLEKKTENKYVGQELCTYEINQKQKIIKLRVRKNLVQFHRYSIICIYNESNQSNSVDYCEVHLL